MAASGLLGNVKSRISADIRQIPAGFVARITLLAGLGNSNSPSWRAKGDGGRRLAGRRPKHHHAAGGEWQQRLGPGG
jgi:hypothetical protein